MPPLPAAMPSCLPWRSLRDGVFSYSSLAHGAEEEAAPAAFAVPAAQATAAAPSAADPTEPAPPDAEKATALGSAFHRAAQFAVETGQLPDAARVDAFARAYGISPAQRARLDAALARWFGSEAYASACAFAWRGAEVPFLVQMDGALMEGEIDLLCAQAPPGSEQAAGTHAVVFDYKTGGSDDESDADLRKKHLLQAQCYAYAVLGQGFGSVELRFMRVERPARAGGPSQPDEVAYAFAAADAPTLKDSITQAYRKAM